MHGQMMDYPLTIGRLLDHANKLYPHKLIVSKKDDGSIHHHTISALSKRCNQLANALIRLGIKAGDRIATFAWNNHQHLEMYYGIPAIGAVCHTLNIRLSADQLAYIVEHAADRVVFIDASVAPLFDAVREKISCIEHFVVFNQEYHDRVEWSNVLDYESLLAAESTHYPWPTIDENTAAGLCYTSGTTGHPKGALYSHRSTYLHAIYTNQANALAFSENDRVLTIVPQFHVMAWGFPFSCLYAGADIVLPGKFMDPISLANLLHDEKITVANGVPTIWTGIYEELKKNRRDLSSVRALVIGGSAMPKPMMEAYEREFGIQALHAWGMTEMSPLGTLSKLQSRHQCRTKKEQRNIRARQGLPLPGVELRVVDDSGKTVPHDNQSSGEIQVRGACIIKNYYRRQADEEQFTADGWFRTGDVATIDEEHSINITDRTKDLIKSGGEWISSIALESALSGHPDIQEVAVIAIPDKKWEERPLAAVVLRSGEANISIQIVRQYLADDFPGFWLPDVVAIIDEVPKTSTGKFDKKVLRRMYAEGKLTVTMENQGSP